VLDRGVARVLRRGIDRGYVESRQSEPCIRGKLLLSETLSSGELFAGRLTCAVDELSQDTIHNRLIKAAMRKLIGHAELEQRLRGRLRAHCARMCAVPDEELSLAAFSRVPLHRNLVHYVLLIEVARLVAISFMPTTAGHTRGFQPFTENESEMGRLFEAFVHNFLDLEQQEFSVAAPHVRWDVTRDLGCDHNWLPQMRTDVMLTNATTRLTIEAKCIAEVYQTRYERPTLRSAHLYQLMTYLTNLSVTPGPKPIGLLLYAGTGRSERLQFHLAGHSVFVRRLDLNQAWPEIHADLLSIIHEVTGTTVASDSPRVQT
jgi:5-methylcytosine-specific restriction enzyme subunit McrC